MARRTLQNIRSKEPGKAPSPGDILYGELAVNYNDGTEAIYLKNSSDKIISFAKEDVIAEAISGLNKLLDTKADKSVVETNKTEINGLKTTVSNNTKSIGSLDTRVQTNTDAISAEKTRAEGQEALKLDKARYQGAQTVKNLANIPIKKRLVIANVATGSQISLSGQLPAGEEVHVIIKNTGKSLITIPIPNTGTYISTGTDSITIDSGKIGEVNFVSDGTNVFVRGL